MSISFVSTSNYCQSHCVISHRLTQQMAIFQPITPHLLFPFSLPSQQYYYVLPLSHTSVLSLLICAFHPLTHPSPSTPTLPAL